MSHSDLPRPLYPHSPTRQYVDQVLKALAQGEQPPALSGRAATEAKFQNPQEMRDLDYLMEDSFLFATGPDVFPHYGHLFRYGGKELEFRYRSLLRTDHRLTQSAYLARRMTLIPYAGALHAHAHSDVERGHLEQKLTRYEAHRDRKRRIIEALMNDEITSFTAVAKAVGVSKSRIPQILNKQLRQWSHPARSLSKYWIDCEVKKTGPRDKKTFCLTLYGRDWSDPQCTLEGLSLREVREKVEQHCGIKLHPTL